MSTKTIKTKKGSATLLEPGIIKYTLNDHSEWTLADAKETHAASIKLSNEGKYFTFMHAKKIFLASKEAQEFIASKECTDHRIAAVLVVQNNGIKLLATLFIKFFKSKSPSMIFSTEAQAFNWMRAEYKKVVKQNPELQK